MYRMKCIVGLGNMGTEYVGTRHNVGFWVLDQFAPEAFVPHEALLAEVSTTDDVLLVKPMTYMNQSGKAVRRVLQKHPAITAQDMLVVHDDWDLPVGRYKLSRGRGASRHNGVKNICDTLGTREFWRLRVGIQAPVYANREVTRKDFVLSRFSAQEKQAIQQLIHDHILPDINQWLADKIR